LAGTHGPAAARSVRRGAVLALSTAGCLLLLDQWLKLWVHAHMFQGQEIPVFGRWFLLHYIENNGMAFGTELGGTYGKLMLTGFRLVAVAGLGWYVSRLVRRLAHPGAIFALALIFAGATGNILDSLFYGLFFNYAGLGLGRVVDMLYFPLWEGYLPAWLPIWGGTYAGFFDSIFNVADSAITVGVALLLLFQQRFFPTVKSYKKAAETLPETNEEDLLT